MKPFEQCLASLVELAKADDLDRLSSVDTCVQAYLASLDTPKDAAHPCDDLAEALMRSAPDTETKGHILDKLFQTELKSDDEAHPALRRG